MTARTSLEYTVLGVVGLFQPCTGYRVRQCFLESPSPHWSGSGGAIYPALRRLEREGFVESERVGESRRSGSHYSLTRVGRTVIRDWLAPPLDPGIGVDVDPLRTQVRLLGLLTPTQRRRFVASALRELLRMEQTARRVHQESKSGDDPFHTIVCLGALRSIQTRRRWLRDVQRLVG